MVAHTKQRRKIISYCNYADLKAAIFGMKPDEVRTTYGLPAKYGNCLNCKTPLNWNQWEFCSQKCKYKYHRIKVECALCGKLFEKLTTLVIYRLNTIQQKTNKPVQRFFCSQRCLGKWNAEIYGFIAHPENILKNRKTKRKWDFEQVFRLRDETGWGARRLSRALGIPTSTISFILRKRVFLQEN